MDERDMGGWFMIGTSDDERLCVCVCVCIGAVYGMGIVCSIGGETLSSGEISGRARSEIMIGDGEIERHREYMNRCKGKMPGWV